MLPLLNIAVRAARSAGNVIVRSMKHVEYLGMSTKVHNDFASDVEHLAEREVASIIAKVYPEHAIMAEKLGNYGNSDTVWIIDALDGTTNFLHGFPNYCVSIAVMVRDKIEHGVVYDPLREELFTASRGNGAQLNNHRLRVGKHKELINAVLATDFSLKTSKHLSTCLDIFSSLFTQAAGIRLMDCAGLNLAHVAAGRLDGYWEIGLKKWVSAAGVLLIEESGGIISDFVDSDNYINSGNIVVGNLNIHKLMIDGITPHLTKELRR